MFSEAVKLAAAKIGLFYLEKNKGDHIKAQQELLALRIIDIKVNAKGITVTTTFPGHFIGPKGSNIKALTAYLKTEIRIVETEYLKEIYHYLLPTEEY